MLPIGLAEKRRPKEVVLRFPIGILAARVKHDAIIFILDEKMNSFFGTVTTIDLSPSKYTRSIDGMFDDWPGPSNAFHEGDLGNAILLVLLTFAAFFYAMPKRMVLSVVGNMTFRFHVAAKNLSCSG